MNQVKCTLEMSRYCTYLSKCQSSVGSQFMQELDLGSGQSILKDANHAQLSCQTDRLPPKLILQANQSPSDVPVVRGITSPCAGLVTNSFLFC